MLSLGDELGAQGRLQTTGELPTRTLGPEMLGGSGTSCHVGLELRRRVMGQGEVKGEGMAD